MSVLLCTMIAVTRDVSNAVLTGRTIVWSSSNTAFATVNASGVVTAVAIGSANIIATSEGQVGQSGVTVTQVPVATVSVSLAASSIVIGATTQATATSTKTSVEDSRPKVFFAASPFDAAS